MRNRFTTVIFLVAAITGSTAGVREAAASKYDSDLLLVVNKDDRMLRHC